MKFILRSILSLLLPALVIGCSTAPATISRVGTGGDHVCALTKHSLGDLLELSLVDPNSEESAHALAHFVEQWQKQRGDTDEGEVSFTEPNGTTRTYVVEFSGTHGGLPLTYFDEITPAVDYRVKRIEHHRREGIGAPLVALRENENRDPIEKYYPPEAITRAITAVIRDGATNKSKQQVSIDLLCPLMNSEFLTDDGETLPLAADFTVPWAALLSRAGNLKRSEFNEALRRQPKRDPQLYLMEPYNPSKEPLIMLHGLFDSPLVWAKLSNSLWADDSIRNRYQIWHYLYNTNAPALYSGRVLRTQLRELRPILDPSGQDPAMQSTTLVAHSMGGIVSRSLITRPGDVFWNAAFTRPFEALELSKADRQSLREAFFWEPETHVKRVVYIAVPHLGSKFADNSIGKRAYPGETSQRVPGLLRPDFIFQPGSFHPAYQRLGEGKLDSVHALSPERPTLRILASLPNSHPVMEHSIIANQGKPGPLEDSSDGVVEYWSSHLDRAESEKIVPADHHAVDHEESVAEIKRILNLP